MKSKANLFLFGAVILIILAVALVAILNKNTPAGSATDLRARAGTNNTLKLVGIVNSVNEAKGTVGLTGVQFSQENRSGEPQDLGDWTVTAPAGFNFAPVSQGMTVTVGVVASTFNIASREMTAVTLTAGN